MFSPETIVAIFLHLLMFICKVFSELYDVRQRAVCHDKTHRHKPTFSYKILMLETLNFSKLPLVPHLSKSPKFSYSEYTLIYLIGHTFYCLPKCIFKIKAFFVMLVFLLVHSVSLLQLLQVKKFLIKMFVLKKHASHQNNSW